MAIGIKRASGSGERVASSLDYRPNCWQKKKEQKIRGKDKFCHHVLIADQGITNQVLSKYQQYERYQQTSCLEKKKKQIRKKGK